MEILDVKDTGIERDTVNRGEEEISIQANPVRFCRHCGKKYIKNENIDDSLPEFLKNAMEWLPACDCLEKSWECEKREIERAMDEESRKNKLKRFERVSIVDSKFKSASFENCDRSAAVIQLAERFANKFLSQPSKFGLYFAGGVGVGKTFASACIANRLIANGRTVLVMNLSSYLNEIRTQGWDKVEVELLNLVKEADMLIIDDLGVENATDFGTEKLFNLIDARYRANKSLIVTSNLTINELGNRLGARIADRLRELCYYVPVQGQSRRKSASEEGAAWLFGE